MTFLLHRRTDWGIRWMVLLACAAVAGTALKAYQWYFSRPLWLDEQMVLLNVRDRAVSDLGGPLWMDQAAPLGWLVLQRGVVTMVGTSDRDIRALPALFGIATLWAAWWMGSALDETDRCRHLRSAVRHQPMDDVLCPGGQALLRGCVLRADIYWLSASGPVKGQRNGPSVFGEFFSGGVLHPSRSGFHLRQHWSPRRAQLVLFAIAWRRAGWRAAAAVALQGLIWLVSFGAHYTLSISVASSDPYLRNYWAPGFPPNDAGATGALRWLMNQGEPLASHPGGSRLWVLFWLTVAYGVAAMLVKRPVMALMILLMPVSGFLLAIFRVMPFTDRLALWTTPALYAAIAIAAGDAFERDDRPRSPREWVGAGVAIVCAVSAWAVCFDIFEKGRQNVIIQGANHDLDDRRGVRLLMNQREPGDVFLTAHLGLPAVWWYGNISTAEPNPRTHVCGRWRAYMEDQSPPVRRGWLSSRRPTDGHCQTRLQARRAPVCIWDSIRTIRLDFSSWYSMSSLSWGREFFILVSLLKVFRLFMTSDDPQTRQVRVFTG